MKRSTLAGLAAIPPAVHRTKDWARPPIQAESRGRPLGSPRPRCGGTPRLAAATLRWRFYTHRFRSWCALWSSSVR
jgi:hypothetical protein